MGGAFPQGARGAFLAWGCWRDHSYLGEGRGRGAWWQTRRVGPLKLDDHRGGCPGSKELRLCSPSPAAAVGGTDRLFLLFFLSFLASLLPSRFLSPAVCSWGCGGGSWAGVNSPSWSQQVLSCSMAGEMLAAHIPQALCPKMILTHPHTYKHPADRQGANACPEM